MLYIGSITEEVENETVKMQQEKSSIKKYHNQNRLVKAKK